MTCVLCNCIRPEPDCSGPLRRRPHVCSAENCYFHVFDSTCRREGSNLAQAVSVGCCRYFVALEAARSNAQAAMSLAADSWQVQQCGWRGHWHW